LRAGVLAWRAVVKASLACCFGQRVDRGSSLVASAGLEVDEILEPDPAVTVRLLEGDRAVLEELHERRSTDPDELRSLLRCQQETLRCDERRLALAHHLHNLAKHPVHLCRQRKLLAVGTEQEPRLGVRLNGS